MCTKEFKLNKARIYRVATVPLSLRYLLVGQLSYLSKYYDVMGISSEGVELTEVASGEGINTQAVRMSRHIDIIRDIKSLYHLYKLFKNGRPTIIHSITPKAGLLSMIAGYAAHVPVRMHTFTGLIFPSRSGLLRSILLNMDRLICLFSTQIIPEGRGVRDEMIRFKLTKKPLEVIGNGNINGVDGSHFNADLFSKTAKNAIRKKLGISQKEYCFIFVGRLVKEKGIVELVDAFIQVNKEYPHTRLLLVGDYEQSLDPLPKYTIDSIDNHPGVLSLGFQKDVRPFFAVSRALAFPSYREGFPNVPLQAGAMGIPSKVSDVNGCNEIIIHQFNGLLIPPRNSQALSNAMSRLLLDKKLYEQICLNARESVINRYDRNYLWPLFRNQYNKQLFSAGINV